MQTFFERKLRLDTFSSKQRKACNIWVGAGCVSVVDGEKLCLRFWPTVENSSLEHFPPVRRMCLFAECNESVCRVFRQWASRRVARFFPSRRWIRNEGCCRIRSNGKAPHFSSSLRMGLRFFLGSHFILFSDGNVTIEKLFSQPAFSVLSRLGQILIFLPPVTPIILLGLVELEVG